MRKIKVRVSTDRIFEEESMYRAWKAGMLQIYPFLTDDHFKKMELTGEVIILLADDNKITMTVYEEPIDVGNMPVVRYEGNC